MTNPQESTQDATVDNPEMCRILTRLGAPLDTDRARMIRAAGMEAVKRELEK